MQKIVLSITACLIAHFLFSQPIGKSDSIEDKFRPGTQIEFPARPSINVYPNPAKNKIILQVKGFEPGMASVRLMDMKGKMIREDSRLLTNGEEDIVMFLSIPAGIYFILLVEKSKMVKKKLIIQ